MVCPNNKLISNSKDQVKPKAQDRQKVFNFSVPKRTKAALVGIFVFQIFNLILLWLYSILTSVSFLVIYLSNNTNKQRPGESNSGGPFGHSAERGPTYLKRSTAT